MDKPVEYLFVSCDIVDHASQQSLEVQTQRVADLNGIVRASITTASSHGIVWASGGDGGHLSYPRGLDPLQAIALISDLRQWSNDSGVDLRISASCGIACSIPGADGRTQLVGHGINLAGRLIALAESDGVLVTSQVREILNGAHIEGVRVHDCREINVKSFGHIEVCLLSLERQFTSYWHTSELTSDKGNLASAIGVADGLGVIRWSRRLLELNDGNREALNALEHFALNKYRVSVNDGILNAVMLDAQVGPEVLKAGTFVERRCGEILCNHGDTGEAMFLVLSGELGVFMPKSDESGDNKNTVADFVIVAGDLAGEIAFVLGRKRTATLRCIKDVSLIAYTYAQITSAFVDSPNGQHYKDIIDRKILSRVVEHVWNSAPYFHNNQYDSASISGNPWRALLEFCSLITLDWSMQTVKSYDAGIVEDRLVILVAGRVKCPLRGDLDGEEYSILYSNLSHDMQLASVDYELVTDVKLLMIEKQGLLKLGPILYKDVIRKISEHIVDHYTYHCAAGATIRVLTSPVSAVHLRGKKETLLFVDPSLGQIDKHLGRNDVPRKEQTNMDTPKHAAITKNFLSHLARGGVKSIPLVGAFIDEMIFGTLEGDTRAVESEKLAKTLAGIQGRLDAQSNTFELILSEVADKEVFAPDIDREIRLLAASVSDPAAHVPSDLAGLAIARLLDRHNVSFEEAEKNPAAAFNRLELAARNVGPDHEMNRAEFVNWLYGLRNDDLESMIVMIPGAKRRITENASVLKRVNELIGWADSSTGPGLTRVYLVAQQTRLI